MAGCNIGQLACCQSSVALIPPCYIGHCRWLDRGAGAYGDTVIARYNFTLNGISIFRAAMQQPFLYIMRADRHDNSVC